MNNDDKLMKCIECMAAYAKRYPVDHDLFPLWEQLGADKFITLLKEAKGRRIRYEIEYRNFDVAVLTKCEILNEELELA